MDADLLFRGGPVWTGLADAPDTTAVAVGSGRVLAAGAEAERLAGPSTRVVDLAGRLAVPGFIDAHVHPVQAGLHLQACDLSDLPADEAAYVRAVGDYAAGHQDEEWVRGGGWAMSAFPGGTPTRQVLDAVVPDRPAYLPNRDGHGVWVNSRALEIAGIDTATADPPAGRIERDAAGAPTGTLHEAAMDLVSRHLPPRTGDQRLEALQVAQQHLHALGVVAWQDAIVGDYAGSGDLYETYLQAARQDLLTGRVTGALWWDRERGLDQLDDLLSRRAEASVGRFRPLAVKIMQDGVAETFTAAMQEPYLDADGRVTGNSGDSFVDPATLQVVVSELDRAGFQVHVHAIGDRAVREALDAFEAARAANGPGGGRHHLAHLQVVHPDDLPRFAALGLTATVQPLWACHEPQMDELTLPFLGEPRSGWQYPFGDLLRQGARLAGGSDWPVSSADPLEGIQVAVTRVAPGEAGHGFGPFLPEQALSLATAMRAYTSGSAYVTHDDDAGVLRAGARGDVVVLDRDVFAGPTDEIADASVDMTVVDGDVLHER